MVSGTWRLQQSHLLSLVNAHDELFYVKWHFKTKQGIKNLMADQAARLKGEDPDYAQRDFFTAIDKGDFPKWKVSIQVMPEAEAADYKVNPFDLTKVWPHKDYPLMEVGEMTLDRNPQNYFTDVEQTAFSPVNVAPGMGYSPDKMLQTRQISYPDTHRYRLGTNYESLPVNRPQAAEAHTYHRDGLMRFDSNGGKSPNYEPNSFGGPKQNPKYREVPINLSGEPADRYNHRAGNDDYIPEHIQRLQFSHFYNADPKYGVGVVAVRSFLWSAAASVASPISEPIITL